MNLNLTLAMEQDNTNPHEFNSFDVSNVLQANIIYQNKKRKFQAEQAGLPLSKHKCWDRYLNSDSFSPSDEILIKKNFEVFVLKEKAVSEATIDEPELESVKDSNCFEADTMDYSSTSVSNETKTFSEISKSTSDKSATISGNCSNGSFNSDPFSLESNPILPNSDGDYNYPHNNFGLHACLNHDESLLEFEYLMDCSCNTRIESSSPEQCVEKEIEQMLYSNGTPPNYLLSSGKWSFNQENQGGTKKLTIDKEFEEYFSMLML